MKLIAFGDSFTAGDNVEYDIAFNSGKRPKDDSEYYQFSYASRLYENMNNIFDSLDIIAVGGWGNQCIWNELYKYFRNNKDKSFFVIVNWTTPFRNGYCYKKEYDSYGGLTFEQQRIKGNNIFYGLESEEDFIYTYETTILAAHYYLRTKNIKHIMINSFFNHRNNSNYKFIIDDSFSMDFWPNWYVKNNTLFDIARQAYCDDTQEPLQSYEHTSFDFTQYTNLDTISSCLHPSPTGHKLIAKTLEPYILKIL